jgi:TolA-binding protein
LNNSSGNSRKIIRIALIALLLANYSLFAQTQGETLLRNGITLFGNTSYDDAIRIFREIILDSEYTGYHDEAYFWIAKSYIALRQYEDAEKNLEFFIAEFPDSPTIPESLYQRGRLLFLRHEYEAAILALKEHIDRFPDSSFVANSYFWIGEALYAQGQFEPARDIFSIVVNEYPSSFKVEAARYRVSLIDLKEREEELLKLIKWSHEEYLNALEDFQRRERNYEQAIAVLQRKLADLNAGAKDREITQLKESIVELEAVISKSESEIDTLKENLDQLIASTITAPNNSRDVLLDLKTELLDLKSYYLQRQNEDEQ